MLYRNWPLLQAGIGKWAKADADFEELSQREFLGGFYLYGRKLIIPGKVIEAALVETAKKIRKGQQAKAWILSVGNFPIEYCGPRNQSSYGLMSGSA